MKFILSLLAFLSVQSAFAELVVYTDRPKAILEPIAQSFARASGESVRIEELAYASLVARLQSEAESSSADLVFVKDMVFLQDLAKKNLFQTMSASPSVDSSMRTPFWTAISSRARTIAFTTDQLRLEDPSVITTYEDLADPKWAGKLCMRSSNSSYNEALIGSLIERLGQAETEGVVRGWIANLAAPPFPNDTKVLEAIENGTCAVGIVNTYYLAGILARNPNFPVSIRFLNQGAGGVHVNGSGIGIAATSKQQALAARFIDHLLSDQVQLELTSALFEYPAKTGLAPSTLIRNWGTFQADANSWEKIGDRSAEAKALMSRVGYR